MTDKRKPTEADRKFALEVLGYHCSIYIGALAAVHYPKYKSICDALASAREEGRKAGLREARELIDDMKHCLADLVGDDYYGQTDLISRAEMLLAATANEGEKKEGE